MGDAASMLAGVQRDALHSLQLGSGGENLLGSLWSANEVMEELGGNLSNLQGVFLCRVSEPSGCWAVTGVLYVAHR